MWGIEDEEDTKVLVCRMEELTDIVTMPILVRHTDGNETLQQLKEDIRKGRLWKELRDYKDCFLELSIQEGAILRGDKIIIPKSLRAGVLEAAHQGHPGKESMTRQMRQLCWWPGVSSDIREFAQTCLPCTARVVRNKTVPIQMREMPERPWQHCSAHYKGPIAGKYYFHVLIDNYSRWPEVAMITSTSFQQLQRKLEDSFSIHGIPESITHDNGPCYNSADWKTFGRKWGFETRHCTPENPKANGIAERFMGVLVMIVHAAVAGG